jgi:hypothetical protein
LPGRCCFFSIRPATATSSTPSLELLVEVVPDPADRLRHQERRRCCIEERRNVCAAPAQHPDPGECPGAKAGLVRSSTLPLDSTKLHANASAWANLTSDEIARAILDEAAATDAAEDELYDGSAAEPTARRHRASICTGIGANKDAYANENVLLFAVKGRGCVAS